MTSVANVVGFLAIAWCLWCILWMYSFGAMMTGVVVLFLALTLWQELPRY